MDYKYSVVTFLFRETFVAFNGHGSTILRQIQGKKATTKRQNYGFTGDITN